MATAMLNRYPRYLPLVRFLNSVGAESILEIGSGSLGLGEFSPVTFVGCDLAYRGEPVSGLLPTLGRAENLPFADGSFDLVICQDTLEHIEPADRRKVIREVFRVGHRHIYLAFPRRGLAYLADRVYAAFHLRIRRLPLPEWLAEHRTVPPVDCNEVEREISRQGCRFRRAGNENVLLHLCFLVAEHCPRLNRFLIRHAERQSLFMRVLLTLSSIPPTYRVVYTVEKT